jgi:Protein of unknown function (DUF2442)
MSFADYAGESRTTGKSFWTRGMSILELEDETFQIEAVECGETELVVTLKDGRRISAPLWWLPRLRDATPEQRANWDIMPFGDAVEWPEIDEHVSVKGLLRGKPAPDSKPPRPDE